MKLVVAKGFGRILLDDGTYYGVEFKLPRGAKLSDGEHDMSFPKPTVKKKKRKLMKEIAGVLLEHLESKRFHPGHADQKVHGRRKGTRGGGMVGRPSSDYPPGADPNAKTTNERFRTADGRITPERQKLHDEIVAAHFAGVTSVDKPMGTILGGGTASGKSSVIGDDNRPPNTVWIDSDSIKKQLPEYNEMLKKGDKNAANFVHDESSILSKRISKEAADRKYNQVLDGTGDSNIQKLEQKIAVMKSGGGKVRGAYVSIPTNEAVTRANIRAAKSGRHVPESFIREVHHNVSKVVPKAIGRGLYDEFELWDNSGPKGSKPKLVARAKGTTLTVSDQGLWQTFLDKGKVAGPGYKEFLEVSTDDVIGTDEMIQMMQDILNGTLAPQNEEPKRAELRHKLDMDIRSILAVGGQVHIPNE